MCADSCEACCPSFWLDETSPPFWVFDPRNRILNDNRIMRRFGRIGLQFADNHRKQFVGVALALTVASMVVTVLGCFGALSDDKTVVESARWLSVWTTNTTSCEASASRMGLRLVVAYECSLRDCVAGDFSGRRHPWDDWEKCDERAILWSHIRRRCNHGVLPYLDCSILEKCRMAAADQQLGAFTTCATLVFALIGCLTRIRWRQDSNFQKLIGCVPDTLGSVANFFSLHAFITGCFYKVHTNHSGAAQDGKELGPGYVAYWFCWAAAIVRAIVHWLVPVPTAGDRNVDTPSLDEDRSGATTPPRSPRSTQIVPLDDDDKEHATAEEER